MIFSPPFPYRLLHMPVVAFLAIALFVGASAAWHLLRKHDNLAIRKVLPMAMWVTSIIVPIQTLIGDAYGLSTLEHQPAKVAVMEGHWDNSNDEPTPLILLGWPDMQREETRFRVETPVLGGLILKYNLTEPIPTLEDFPPEDRPNPIVVFWSFWIMADLDMLVILAGVWNLWLRWCGQDRLSNSKTFPRLTLPMEPSGLIAILVGWFTTGMGRQPWVVHGLTRTADTPSTQSVT